MVAVGGSSCVIIDSTLLACVNGALVVNVNDTQLLADVDGSLLDDFSGWLLADVALLADIDGLLWSDNGARCHAVLLMPLRGHTGHEMHPRSFTASEKSRLKKQTWPSSLKCLVSLDSA